MNLTDERREVMRRMMEGDQRLFVSTDLTRDGESSKTYAKILRWLYANGLAERIPPNNEGKSRAEWRYSYYYKLNEQGRKFVDG